MTDTFVTLNPGVGGAKMRTLQVNVGGNTVEEEYVVLTDDYGNPIGTANPLSVADAYRVFDNFGGWQTGAGGVLTFNAAAPCDLIWVRADNGSGANVIATFDPSGGTPSTTAGIPLDDGIAVPVTLISQTVKVYAPTGVVVKVWGYRYS